MFALSGRTLLHLLLWILVMPLSLVFARLADARANELAAGGAQQDLPCPGGPLQNFVTGTSESGVPSPEAVANGEPLTGRWWEPGSRSYWHCHGGGQFVIVMEGEGRAQKRGERMRDLRVGDIEFALPAREVASARSVPSYLTLLAALDLSDPTLPRSCPVARVRTTK